MACTTCASPTVVYKRNYSGESLCSTCFNHSILEKVRKTISRQSMLCYGDRVGIAVSGGKDSLSLLHILSGLSESYGTELLAITVEEGIPGYREEGIENSKKAAESLDIPLYVYTFEELYGITTERALEARGDKGPPACTICGVLRRKALEVAAQRLGVNVLATAHNLDDFIQTVLINLFTGGLDRIGRLDPDLTPIDGAFTRRIKPLMEVYEEEVAFYAFLNNLPFQSERCPHVSEGLRDQLRDFLNRLEAQRPGIKHNLFRGGLELAKRLQGGEEKPLNRCSICGYPSSQPICSSCRILGTLSLKA